MLGQFSKARHEGSYGFAGVAAARIELEAGHNFGGLWVKVLLHGVCDFVEFFGLEFVQADEALD